MRPVTTSTTIAAGVANAIALSQALGGAGPLVLNGAAVSAGVATLSPARRVIVTSAANDSARQITIVGTDRNGNALTEAMAGSNGGAAQSTQDFLTVTSITFDGAAAGNVTAGTNNVASGPWIVMDRYQTDSQLGISCNILSGAPTYDIELTYDNVWQLPAGVSFPRTFVWGNMQGLQADGRNNLVEPVMAARLLLRDVGGVGITAIQQGPGG